MLDFFVIFSKSGIVLFATVNEAFNNVNGLVNKLIKHAILEERIDKFHSDNMALEYLLDNEFELVFVVAYQKMLSLSYIDKFLTDVQRAFRDKFNDYDLRSYLLTSNATENQHKTDQHLLHFNIVDFNLEYKRIYSKCCKIQQNIPQVEMRTFQDSAKSKKTVASMIIQPSQAPANDKAKSVPLKEIEKSAKINAPLKLKNNLSKTIGSPKSKAKSKEVKSKKGKEARQWTLEGKDDTDLDFSKKNLSNGDNESSVAKNIAASIGANIDAGEIEPNLDFETSDESSEEEPEIDQKEKKSFFGSFVKSFSYNKVLVKSDLEPVLAQLRDHLIAKNVAIEIATKLCDSVSGKLEGQQVNTWLGLKGFVRNSLEESVLRILSPNRNINILSEIKSKSTPPYVIVFCGVNGVGKSTNLAKISNWLIMNGVKVLVIACDTFRAGAIEQLKTHVTALKRIHEKDGKTKIDLYEKGYGKDSAAIALEAINYARTSGYNCCLVDTAGRMQDNEPLMRQLSKLIKINEPDLTLFVGEALVGNEAVDQLMKFNNSLLDHGCRGTTSNSSAINGIVLTKFDTIDDQVGAAVSMTYITGQPIVFVGVGQTYKDLKQLNAKAVVKALMK